ncbi:copper chaperone PCu(A)C [Loktanella sp. S4079]|uniref:copper chaperone PCu(A)C n=1 Tax=Loktanella sp. S4079 TaxID=579483 RepID=UPI0005FA3B93|nr:copper chaperone PCu(A)C [Loktanella sp. S4079]KJZ20067.1 hypothetical protein TW80_04275 [Loktanella sp. S4079]
MKLTTLTAATLVAFSSYAAMAEPVITVTDARAFETPPTAMSGGGFMHIKNDGDTDDRLIGITADFPKVELHTTEFTDGIAKMMHADGVTVPAGGMVALEPGGYHVMFMGLRGDPLEVGETIPATLVFEQSGEIEVRFDVVARTMEHSH